MIGIAMVAAAGIAQTQAAGQTGKVVLKVNGEAITQGQLDFAIKGLQRQMAMQKQSLPQDRLRQMAVREVVDEKLLAQEATREKLEPDTAGVDKQLAALAKQVGGRDKLETMLGQTGVTYAEYRDAMLERSLVQQLVKAKIQPSVKVTEAEAKKFYDENPKYFKRPEQVHARHILFTVKPNATEAEKKAARAKAEAARQRALKGEDFATLAKELSEGPSAKNGGDLGFFAKSQMVKPFGDAAFALKPGQISGVVETRFGYHVIKVEERRPAGTQPFADAKADIEGFLGQQKLGQAVQSFVSSLRAKAKIQDLGAGQAAAPQAAGK